METFLIVKKRRTARKKKIISKEAEGSSQSSPQTMSGDGISHQLLRRPPAIGPSGLESWMEEEDDAGAGHQQHHLRPSQNGIIEAGLVVSAVGRPSLEGIVSSATSITDEDVNQQPSVEWSPEIPFENVHSVLHVMPKRRWTGNKNARH